jgi:hypothetical protein
MQQVVFVQVSDTHFGPQLLNKRFGWIKGYREHDVVLLTAFQAALRDVRRVTGLKDDDKGYYGTTLHSAVQGGKGHQLNR